PRTCHPPQLPSFPTRRSSDLRALHAVVVEADLLEQVGDQLLVLRSGLGADVLEQLGRSGERRLLVGLVGDELRQRAVECVLPDRSEEHTSGLQSRENLVWRLL